LTAEIPRSRGRKANLIPSILRAFGPRPTAPPWDTEDSIREELFSIERLEGHAESLAAAQHITATPLPRRSLAVRLKDNETVLLEAYRAIGSAAGEGLTATPAAEWLLDNYHLVEEQIREIRDDLPSGYYRQLPKLADGPFAGYPRVFGIAWAFVAHTDSRFDSDMLCRFVRTYQRVQPLTIGELWAVAITLRIVLVENLRRAAKRIVSSGAARREADRVPGAPAGDERPRERGVEEIDRHGAIQHAAHARWGDRPPVGAAILVEPCRDVGMPLAETARRNPEPDADRKALLGHGDHLSRVARHP
jgi:hypothetical protein